MTATANHALQRSGKLLIWIGIGALAVGSVVHCLQISEITADLQTTLGSSESNAELIQAVSTGVERFSSVFRFPFILYAIGFVLILTGASMTLSNQSANKAAGNGSAVACALTFGHEKSL